MQKKLFLTLFALAIISFAGNAQNENTTQPKETTQPSETGFLMGLNAGWDDNVNAFMLDNNTQYNYSYTGIKPRYNIGFDLIIKTSKKLRSRIEMKFVNVKYGIIYAPSYTNSDGSHMDNTIVNLNYFDLNFHLDYLLLTKGKFQLFVSPGIRYEYKIGEGVGGNNFNFLYLDRPNNIFGGAVSAIVKYNLTKHWGVTFIPEYTYFFSPFVSGNNQPYQRLSSNFGFEYKF
jgi:opacity protein-like surface antigen